MELVQTRLQKSLAGIFKLVDVNRIASDTLKNDSRVVVSGLGGTAKGLFVAALWQAFRRPIVLVAPDPAPTERLRTDIGYFHRELNGQDSDRVVAFPALDTDPYSGLSSHAELEQVRATTLWQLRSQQADIVVASGRALGVRLPLPAQFDSYGLHLKVGDEVSPELMLEHLSTAGYIREEPVGAVGEFSQRGGIVDVFSPLMAHPARIEFFGDSIDSIREFDPEDQRSRNPLARIDILPMQEHFLPSTKLREWAAGARQQWGGDTYQEDLNAKLLLADEGLEFPGARFLIPSLSPLEATFMDYLDEAAFVFDEAEAVGETYGAYFAVLEERYSQTLAAGGVAVSPARLILPPEEFALSKGRYPGLDLEELASGELNLQVVGQPSRRFHGRMREMVETARQSFEAGHQVILLGSTLGMAERLRDVFHEYGVPCQVGFGELPLKPVTDTNAPLVAIGRLSGGFRLPDIGLELFAEPDLLDETERVSPSLHRKQRSSAFLSDLEDLESGDYVVHIDHGIGRYGGLTTIHDRECMVLSYQEDDRLYVPLERLDLIQRYSAAEGSHPKLDRLGGTTWVQRKTRVRRAIRDMAEELLRLYAERRVAVGHSFPADTEWQKEFEESFQYEETQDQRTSIADIKRDMEAETPMDRLVCGDVGYGKTEVAMRAVFKAVSDGKQAAILAPTTVLCFQHFETLKERFAAFPITIAMLSRFVPPQEQKQVVAKVEAGKTDVLVGTHRLLSKDVEFHDLGLLIVDEEQRFGVAHKERLKQLKRQVDVVTLTATPIPRTLHMALTGLRDMSVIETPPRDRLAIHTEVVKFSSRVIENAIDFEMDRGGQVYLVHNRVESIYSLADLIRRICPRARIGVGHGQMSERELERVMLGFMRHEFDVLVSTTIIENGLDIPLANTMIVNRADRYGLAQLYQLRGRVGRSNRRAYAYLLIPQDKALTSIARRRLAAIREFSELGSGFRIAALDLELRGAGNLLGGQQHGHIEAIGFDLYCQMLERTMEELRTGQSSPEVETTLSLSADLRIPPDFVSDEALRLKIYKRVASAKSEKEIDDRYRELEDRFGDLPVQIDNLLEYARLRIQGRALGVESIERKREFVDIVFNPEARVDPDRIVQALARDRNLSFTPPATLRMKTAASGQALFGNIQCVLRELS